MTGAMGEGRVRPLTGDDRAAGRGPVLYWMQRDQRAHDNWALLHAQAVARAAGRPLAVVFCLVPEFLDAARRQYAFMLAGLRETAADLAALNIPFVLLSGDPAREIADFARRHDAARLVLDLNPLRLPTPGRPRWRGASRCRSSRWTRTTSSRCGSRRRSRSTRPRPCGRS